jgi:hypothetical protein
MPYDILYIDALYHSRFHGFHRLAASPPLAHLTFLAFNLALFHRYPSRFQYSTLVVRLSIARIAPIRVTAYTSIFAFHSLKSIHVMQILVQSSRFITHGHKDCPIHNTFVLDNVYEIDDNKESEMYQMPEMFDGFVWFQGVL